MPRKFDKAAARGVYWQIVKLFSWENGYGKSYRNIIKQIHQHFNRSKKFEGKVMKTSLQGAIIDIGESLPGFLHISQVVNTVHPDTPVINLEDTLKIGDTITVWVKRILKDTWNCR